MQYVNKHIIMDTLPQEYHMNIDELMNDVSHLLMLQDESTAVVAIDSGYNRTELNYLRFRRANENLKSAFIEFRNKLSIRLSQLSISES